MLITDRAVWKALLTNYMYNVERVDNFNRKIHGDNERISIRHSFSEILKMEILNRYKNQQLIEVIEDYICTIIWDGYEVNEILNKIFEILAEDEF